MYIRSLFLFSLVFFLNSCTTIPVVNPSWIKANCPSLGYQVNDTKEYSNCNRTHNGVYSCKMSEGNFVGRMKNGEFHGKGMFQWNNGGIFEGQFRNDEMWCGIRKKGNNFISFFFNSIIFV